MTGKQMIKTFKALFPGRAEHVIKWIDNGHKRITILCDDRQTYLFTVDKGKFTLEGRL